MRSRQIGFLRGRGVAAGLAAVGLVGLVGLVAGCGAGMGIMHPEPVVASSDDLRDIGDQVVEQTGVGTVAISVPACDAARVAAVSPLPHLAVTVSCTGQDVATVRLDGMNLGDVSCAAPDGRTILITLTSPRPVSFAVPHRVDVTGDPGAWIAVHVLISAPVE